MRVAEIDRDLGGHGEPGVLGHFLALVPGQGPAQLRRPRQELVTHSDGRAEDDVGEGAAAAELIRTGIWAAPSRHQSAAERMPKIRNTALPAPDRPGAPPRPGNAPRFCQPRSGARTASPADPERTQATLRVPLKWHTSAAEVLSSLFERTP